MWSVTAGAAHSRERRARLSCALPLAFLAAALPLRADGVAPALPQAPQVQAIYVETPPVIDGKLDDACWAQAARVESFFMPLFQRPLPEETVGLICVGDRGVYAGFICKDRTPDDIVAVETRRNGDTIRDDSVEFWLDPEHNHQNIYYFGVTARGTQADSVPGGSATKTEWRGDWTAAAARTPEGWTAEIAIPYSILRYPAGQGTFGFGLVRRLSAESLTALYPPMPTASVDANLLADLTGLHLSAAAPRPIFMPYTTFGLGDGAGDSAGFGLDMQYQLGNGLTALAVVNPDFTQIEESVEPISFSYTERYRPELRPFFVTGLDGFFPPDGVFYTRRIGDFDAGAKVFGTVGRDTIGLLNAITIGDENALAGLWRHQFGPDFSGQMALVSHSAGGLDDLALGFRLHRIWRGPEGRDQFWAETYRSDSEAGSGRMFAIGGHHGRGNGEPWYGWYARLVQPGFQPALGYYYDQNSIGGSLAYGRDFRYESGPIGFRGWQMQVDHFPRLEGGGALRTRLLSHYQWRWQDGWVLEVGGTLGRQYDQPTPDGYISVNWNAKDLYRGGGLFALTGTRAGGAYTELGVGQGLRPWKRVSLSIGLDYSRLAPPSPDAYHAYQLVFTTSYDLTTEKSIAARFIARDGGLSVYAAYRQVVRRGTDAYVILGDPDPSHTGFVPRLAVKVVRVL